MDAVLINWISHLSGSLWCSVTAGRPNCRFDSAGQCCVVERAVNGSDRLSIPFSLLTNTEVEGELGSLRSNAINKRAMVNSHRHGVSHTPGHCKARVELADDTVAWWSKTTVMAACKVN